MGVGVMWKGAKSRQDDVRAFSSLPRKVSLALPVTYRAEKELGQIVSRGGDKYAGKRKGIVSVV